MDLIDSELARFLLSDEINTIAPNGEEDEEQNNDQIASNTHSKESANPG
jgi:hypothetical protein